MQKRPAILLFIILIIFNLAAYATPAVDPLPSWNEGNAKKAILDFINVTTDKKNPQYVPPEKRVATFDQDGTLWVEQPMYTQVLFAIDRVIALAPKHPEWKTKEPFKSLLTHDKAAIAKFTEADLAEIVMASDSDLPVLDFPPIVKNWLNKTKNPRWNRPYTELIYQPMLEVINLFRANGYKTYIVTGGSQDFVRVYSNQIYGIPAEKVIGTSNQIQYHYNSQGLGELIPIPKPWLDNNFSGKAADIYLFIGQAGQAAFGNSTGDQQMLEYTQAGKGAHLIMLVHHDDALREYAYGPESQVGTFSDALMTEANKRGWQVISMKKDWKRIFLFDN